MLDEIIYYQKNRAKALTFNCTQDTHFYGATNFLKVNTSKQTINSFIRLIRVVNGKRTHIFMDNQYAFPSLNSFVLIIENRILAIRNAQS